MEEARRNGLLTDVTLVTEKKEFKAHKLILAVQSPFFKTRFEPRWERADDRVELNDVKPEILEMVLQYMYTGKIEKIKELSTDCIYELFSISDEYGLDKLRGTCEATLEKNIQVENVVDLLIRADMHNGGNLKKACIDFIISNRTQVQECGIWSKLESKTSEGLDHEKLRMEVLEAWFKSAC